MPINITGGSSKREKRIENIFEDIMAEHFPNGKKELDIQLQESQSPEQGETIENHAKTYHN